MIKSIYNIRLLLFVLFASAVCCIGACKKSDNPGSSKVELLSFGPSGAKHGDTIYFIGHNLNKVTAVQLTGATVAANAFIQQTSERITFLIPTATQEGYVTLKTPDGDIVSKTKINFNVSIKITSMTKQAKPGENISIKGEYLNWIKQIVFAKDVAETTFVSRTFNELVVKIPAAAQSGKLSVYFVGTKPLTVETDSVLLVTMPTIGALSPNPVLPKSDLTITGANLDMISGITFTGVTTPVTTFVSQSATKLVVTVPEGVLKGKLKFSVRNSTQTVESEVLDYLGGLPPLADFPYAIYTDALQNGFQDWSWAGRDFSSTEIVRQGNNSIKAMYGSGGYEGITLHNDGGPSTSAYTKLEFSVYGTAGTGGKTLNLVVNGGWGSPYTVTVPDGEWKTFTFNMSDIGNPASITELIFQSAGWSGNIYIDHVGLR
ncbi:MAG: IPT/TIG domain-containing protein [Chitinophagaceae bacterium]